MDGIRSLFSNPTERRPRAGWRLLIALIVYLVAILAAVAVGEVLFAVSGTPSPTTGVVVPPSLAISGVFQLIAFGVATLLLGIVVDRRRLSDFGLRLDRHWWADLGFGLALGAGLHTGVFAVALAAGWIRIVGFTATANPDAPFVVWLLAAAVGYLTVGIYEELFARGYLLTNVAEGLAGIDRRLAVIVAVLASSGVFAGLHASNPNASTWSTIALLLAGVLLATGFVVTGELAIPIGLHITWNFFQGVVWGFPVSGVDTGVTLVAIERTGPTLFTGGAFGPEGGLLGTAAKLIGIIAILLWVYYRTGELSIDPRITRPDLRNDR